MSAKVINISDNEFQGSINMVNLLYPLGFRDIPAFEIHLGALSNDPEGWMFRRAAATGVPAHCIAMSGAFDVTAAKRLSELVRREGFRIVHTHGYRSSMVARTAAGLFGMRAALVNTVRGIPANPGFRFRAYHRIDCATMRMSARTIAVSEKTRDALVGDGIPESRVTVIENGLEIDSYNPDTPAVDFRAAFGIAPGDVVIGCLGRLHPMKGLGILMNAARGRLTSGNPPAKLLFVGDGPMRAELEALAAKLGVADKVVFAGFQEDVQTGLAAMDVVALPSLSEGLPVSLIEALAMKKPIVATTVGGIPQMIDEGVNGLLVPPNDPAALKAAVERLAGDPALRERMGAASLVIARERFSIERMCARIADVYDEVLAPRRFPG